MWLRDVMHLFNRKLFIRFHFDLASFLHRLLLDESDLDIHEAERV